jgi:peptide/nickel transport system permease protein
MELTFGSLCLGSVSFLGIFLVYVIATGSRTLRNYLITRLLLTIPSVFILVTLVFIIMRVIPGDPVSATIKPGDERIDELRAELGINKPIHEQYFDYLTGIVQGDLGESFALEADRPVLEMIGERLPATLELVIPAILIMLTFGILSGAFAAHKHKQAPDYSFRLVGIVFYSIPIFWSGLMLQVFFGLTLGLLPTSKRISGDIAPRIERQTNLLLIDTLLAGDFEAFINVVEHMILPTATLSIALIGVFIRLTRSNMIEVLQEDYVTAARARGVPDNRVVYRHALRNSFIPIMTLIGLQVAILLGGAVLTETTFSWPGLGLLLRNGIAQRDFPVVQGVVTVFAIVVAFMSTLTDIIYAFIDPRIRY